jgi:peptide/nickel transport system substrate-binding protein
MGYYPALEQQITKYPYDPRRTEQLLAEAGMTRQGDGFYTLSAGERFAPSLRSVAGGQEEQEATILVDGFRRVGIDASATVLTAAQSRDGEALASFPALASAQTTLAEDTVLTKFRTARIPTATNRWTGSNLGGYSNPEYDRLYDVFSAALDRAERDQAMIRLMALVSEDLPGLPLYYNPRVVAHGADLQGPRAGGDTFNVYEWAFKS